MRLFLFPSRFFMFRIVAVGIVVGILVTRIPTAVSYVSLYPTTKAKTKTTTAARPIRRTSFSQQSSSSIITLFHTTTNNNNKRLHNHCLRSFCPTAATTITTAISSPSALYQTTTTTATTSLSGEHDDDDDDNNNNGTQQKRRLGLLQETKRRRLMEFVQIAFPALIQLAAEPLAGLVDTVYLGRLGPAVLGGAGVAVSAQYAVGKLYNDPLLRTSISLVAAQDGKKKQRNTNKQTAGAADTDDTDDDDDKKDLSIAVSTALLLALTVGFVQMVVYTIFCKGISRGMGLSPSSEMWPSCVGYLQIRALGTPAATLWLVSNGIFRGLGDTKTPLIYSFFFTGLNAILDPIFIFVFHWGAAGAAAGTALAQYAALIPLLFALNNKVPIRILGQFQQLKQSLVIYLRAGGLVFFRTIGKVMAYAVCARQAALLGSMSAAAYNLTFQLGFATTQICEAVAVAIQTLLARELAAATTPSTTTTTSTSTSAKDNDNNSITPDMHSKIIRYLINTSVLMGGAVSVILSFVTYIRRDWILQGLTTDVGIQRACASIFPVVLLTQVLKGLAYPVNGILMGGLDWIYSMITMWLANIVCIGLIQYWLVTQQVAAVSLQQLWIALAAFMGTQVIAGIIRYESKTGIWKVLRSKKESKGQNSK